jgi:hypothetical protein
MGNRKLLDGSPQQALPARAAFVAMDGTKLVGFVAGHRTRRLGCDGELQWVNVVEGNEAVTSPME